MCVVKIKFHLFLISISRLLFDNAFYFIQVKTIIDSNKKNHINPGFWWSNSQWSYNFMIMILCEFGTQETFAWRQFGAKLCSSAHLMPLNIRQSYTFLYFNDVCYFVTTKALFYLFWILFSPNERQSCPDMYMKVMSDLFVYFISN